MLDELNPEVNEELDTTTETETDTDTDNGLSGDQELMEALKRLNSEEEDEVETETETEEDETEDNEDDLDSEEDDEVETDTQKGQKREQSKEENARFAAQRRQKELEDKIAEERERIQNESPEFKLAQQLSKMYGARPDEILKQMQEAALQKEAEEKQIPVEMLRERQEERQRLEDVEAELNNLRYTAWQSRVKAEGQVLQTKYSVLSDADLEAAEDYLLNVVANVDMPMEQAIYALHGEKIIKSLAEAKIQDDLATASGRKKKTPLAPNNGKAAATTKELSPQEKYIARQMGMTDADYLKYK